jgi:hypothetical protein
MIPTRLDKLIPDETYLVVINWNQSGDFRFDNEYRLIGKFIEHQYIRGRTRSFDSGLTVLLTPNRINAIFESRGERISISSANTFYKIVRPTKNEIQHEKILRYMHLSDNSKHLIRSFL